MNAPEILEDFEGSEALLVADACNITNEILSKETTNDNITTTINNTITRLKYIQKKIEDCQHQIKATTEAAQAAYDKPADFWRSKKPAIVALQNACQEIAKSQSSSFELQKLMFEQQNYIAKIIGVLFRLTIKGIDQTRKVVNALRKGLDEASEDEISTEAREELETLCKQLSNQLDLMEKQENLREYVSELEAVIDDFREELTLLKSNTDYNKSILKQKKLSIILWCTVVGVLINFCGIIAVLYIILK